MRSETQIASDDAHIKKMRSTANVAKARVNTSARVSKTALSCDLSTAAESADETRTDELDERSIAALVRFFTVLDQWDRGVKQNAEVV
jgi:hypothetical protein